MDYSCIRALIEKRLLYGIFVFQKVVSILVLLGVIEKSEQW